jgi:23S rRNA (uracil1939-C5)-methyltransferase
MRKAKEPKFYHNLEIVAAGSEGKCIARVDGKVVFVDYAVPGDIVNVRVYSKRKGNEFAHITELLTPSPLRVGTFCEHFGLCGGCKWQQMGYPTQLKYKQQQVTDAFDRIGKFPYEGLNPIIGSDKTQYYRNKLEYSFTARKWLTSLDNKDDLSAEEHAGLGYHVPTKFDKVLDVNECYLMDDIQNQIRNFIKAFTLENNYAYYDLNKQVGFMRNVIIRNNSQNQWMVIVVFANNDEDKITLLLNALKDKFPQITSLMYVINGKVNDTISDLEVHLFNGEPFLIQELEDLKFKIGPKSFFQTNADQTLKLYSKTREFANLAKDKLVYDLYTGVGSIALFVAHQAKAVIGIEYVEQAIDDAKENAALNNITNTTFYAGDMKDVLTPALIEKHGKPDVIITDPPRAGMHTDVIEQILLVEPKTIVYVSCNPATQARDIALLTPKYKVTKVQPVDMFPHTHHVENIALLELI